MCALSGILVDFQHKANIVVTPTRKYITDMFPSEIIVYRGRNVLPFYSKVKLIISLDSFQTTQLYALK